MMYLPDVDIMNRITEETGADFFLLKSFCEACNTIQIKDHQYFKDASAKDALIISVYATYLSTEIMEKALRFPYEPESVKRLSEWKNLARDQKELALELMVPTGKIYNYHVEGLDKAKKEAAEYIVRHDFRKRLSDLLAEHCRDLEYTAF